MSEILSAKQAAIALGTDARTVRKFLRDTHGLIGQGKRWQVDGSKKALKKLKEQFETWDSNRSRPAAKPDDPESTPPAEGDDEPTLEDLTEPSIDELEDIEDLDLEDYDDD